MWSITMMRLISPWGEWKMSEATKPTMCSSRRLIVGLWKIAVSFWKESSHCGKKYLIATLSKRKLPEKTVPKRPFEGR